MATPGKCWNTAAAISMIALLTLWLPGCSRENQSQVDQTGTPAPEATPQAGATPNDRPSPTQKSVPPAGPGAITAVAPKERPAVVPEPPRTVRIPAGTAIKVRTTNTLSTKTAAAGEPFAASLEEPLVVDGNVIAAKGAAVTGVVSAADDGGRVKGVAHMAVRLTQLKLANGAAVELQTNSFTKLAPQTKKDDALKVGIGSGIGAAIGAIAGGGKGAAIGAGAGAGAGTGVVLATHGKPAVIPSESVLTFRLQNPVEVRR